MKLEFVSPTNRMRIVDDNDVIDISPVTTIWLWKKSWNCYVKICDRDADRLNGLEVTPQIPSQDYAAGNQVYLRPVKDIDPMINRNVPYPERVLLTKVDVSSLFENAERTIWVRRTPVGICFVSNGKELIVSEDMVKVLGDDNVLRPILEVYCDLNSWDKYVVEYRESYKDIVIENVEFGLCDDSKESKFTTLMAEFLFGKRKDIFETELNIAYAVTMVVGDISVRNWKEGSELEAVDLLQRVLAYGIPNGMAGYAATRNIELIVSLFEGKLAVKYVRDKSVDVLRDCYLKKDHKGKLRIYLNTGVNLSEISNAYFKGTSNDALSSLITSASIS